MTKTRIELPFRAQFAAPHGHSSTNGRVFRYFLTWDECAHTPGRIGPPQYAPGHAWTVKAPAWLKAAQDEAREPRTAAGSLD